MNSCHMAVGRRSTDRLTALADIEVMPSAATNNIPCDPRIRSARARVASLTASSRATPEQLDDARQELAALVAEPRMRELAGSLSFSRRVALVAVLLGGEAR